MLVEQYCTITLSRAQHLFSRGVPKLIDPDLANSSPA